MWRCKENEEDDDDDDDDDYDDDDGIRMAAAGFIFLSSKV
jgi:hypothetical protein